MRQLSLTLQGLKETCLPLSNPDSCVQAGDVLDLNNSDLLAVTVVLKDGTRQRRFLVVDLMQIILIEPDAHRLGWGVAKFSGFLQVENRPLPLFEFFFLLFVHICCSVNVIHLANFPLKDLEVNSDKEDSRCLHVTVHKPTIGSTGGAPTPLLSAAFTFDDHIRFIREIF